VMSSFSFTFSFNYIRKHYFWACATVLEGVELVFKTGIFCLKSANMASREWEISRCDLARLHLKMIISSSSYIIVIITRSFIP
jgi:hypothetical protein